MERKQKYCVGECFEGNEIWGHPPMSLQDAEDLARREAMANPTHQIYITWYRASDSQRGYYNPDGAHSITGRAW